MRKAGVARQQPGHFCVCGTVPCMRWLARRLHWRRASAASVQLRSRARYVPATASQVPYYVPLHEYGTGLYGPRRRAKLKLVG